MMFTKKRLVKKRLRRQNVTFDSTPLNHITVNFSGPDRNFPCQTLKIRNVSLVVMGS
jgi:hypothetical protein